jgi:hypothetical protein
MNQEELVEETSERFPAIVSTEEAAIQALPEDASVDGDYIVSLETGEVYGFATRPEFQEIATDENAYWVLERIQRAEADMTAAIIRTRAVIENCRRMESVQRNIVTYLRTVYENQLTEWARPKLTGKAKSIKTPFATVGFRASGGGLKVLDATAAERWASEFDPDAVKVTREFQITKAAPATKELITRVLGGEVAPGDEEAADGIRAAFIVKEAENKGYVDTGVKLP